MFSTVKTGAATFPTQPSCVLSLGVSSSGKNSPDSAEATATIPLPPSWQRENLRFVVFLQDRKTLHILGAAATAGVVSR
jgi:hypothetical protein